MLFQWDVRSIGMHWRLGRPLGDHLWDFPEFPGFCSTSAKSKLLPLSRHTILSPKSGMVGPNIPEKCKLWDTQYQVWFSLYKIAYFSSIMGNMSIFVTRARIMYLTKEINSLAFPHLVGWELGIESRVHSKLVNPQWLEGQVKISPWYHPMTQVSHGYDLPFLSKEFLLPVQGHLRGGAAKRNLSLEQLSPFFPHTQFPST